MPKEDQPLAQGYTAQNNQISPKESVLIFKTHTTTLFETPSMAQTLLKKSGNPYKHKDSGHVWESDVGLTSTGKA